jgi:glycosyltransferase involved in cell wall biosynthesis
MATDQRRSELTTGLTEGLDYVSGTGMDTSPVIVYLVTEDWYFEIHRLPLARAALAAGYRVILITRARAHRDRLEGEGIEVIDIGWDRRSFKVRHVLYDIAKIMKLYKSIKPAIVHHVAIKPSVLGSIAALLTRTTPVVNNLAGLGGAFTSRGLRSAITRSALRGAFRFLFNRPDTRTIVENSDDRDFLVNDAGVRASSVVLIKGVGVDTSRFCVRPEPAGTPVISMVSRMLWPKGIAELVEAARILKGRQLPVRIQLIGEPDPDNRDSVPVSCLKEWNSQGIVSWLGYRDNIPQIWANSNLAVLPSFYREGVPRSLMEAAACGRALIAADMPGCREIVQHGKNGLLVPPRDAEALADAIEQLVNDPDKRRRMGLTGRQLVEQDFAETHVITETLALYRGLLSPRRAVG